MHVLRWSSLLEKLHKCQSKMAVILCRLRHGSEVAERDIVQFVPFRDYKQVIVIIQAVITH